MKKVLNRFAETKYGFEWGSVSVERVCSNNNKPKLQVLRIRAMDGKVWDVIMRPRSTKFVEVFP